MKKILLILVMVTMVTTISAVDTDNKSVTLVVSGTGSTKDDAVKNALRSAIEQTYGTFVSANTQIVNDELTKDEIVSISSGNVEKFTELSQEKLPNGQISVNVKAKVSIGKLIKYAESKGASAELAGATFMMNIKIKELNKENTGKALCNMYDKMLRIARMNLFDYSVKIDDPKRKEGSQDMYIITVNLTMVQNQNFRSMKDEFINTIKALMLTEEEIEDYKKSNIPVYFLKGVPIECFGIDRARYWNRFHEEGPALSFNPEDIINKSRPISVVLTELIFDSSFSFTITDNIGNESVICKNKTQGSDLLSGKTNCAVPLFWDYVYNQKYKYHYNVLYGCVAKRKEGSEDNFLGPNLVIRGSAMDSEIIPKYHPGFPNYFRSSRLRYEDLLFEENKKRKGAVVPVKINLYYSGTDLSKLTKIDVLPISPSSILVRSFDKNMY